MGGCGTIDGTIFIEDLHIFVKMSMKNHRYILATIFALILGMGTLSAQKGNPNPTSSQMFCNVFVPNAFTPNGDNINDRFEVKHAENCQVVEFNMKIFDRWGRLIYESHSMEKDYAWDGTAEGKEVMQGVYMWTVYAKVRTLGKATDFEEHQQQGTVVVIR